MVRSRQSPARKAGHTERSTIVTIQTSTTVTVDITFRVACDLDALSEHLGGVAVCDPEGALVEHITWPIVHNSFDTPATIERIDWSGDVA